MAATLAVVSYAPGSARDAIGNPSREKHCEKHRGTPTRPGPSDTSVDPDGYGIYGKMGHRERARHEVEGLVRGFPGGGSSPLRRITEAPQMRGFRADRARQGTIGNTAREKPCENQPSSGGGEILPRITGADWGHRRAGAGIPRFKRAPRGHWAEAATRHRRGGRRARSGSWRPCARIARWSLSRGAQVASGRSTAARLG
jgi:hypothetical protein